MLVLARRAMIAAAPFLAAATARAETAQLRVSHGYSTGYLPLMAMRERQLIEKHAASAGLGTLKVEWQIQDGGNNINDAMLAGALDIAGVGVPGYLVLHDRTRGKKQEVIGVTALNTGSLWLNTINPKLKSLRDYGPGDRIALPGIKTSYAAVVLQMAVAKAFGIENYAKLDPLTVGIPHPEAYAAMMSGKTEITSHMASSPFSYQELKNPAVHRVLSTRDEVGPLSILMTMTQKQFANANPGIIRAFISAQEEANRIIAADHAAAADIYNQASGLHMPKDELLQTLDDPENTYDIAPSGTMAYVDFLSGIGTLKAKPTDWKELFLPNIQDKAGS
jgi:NitT/TauT family transport system substrate-binding protein